MQNRKLTRLHLMCGCFQASKPFCWAFGNSAGKEMLLLSAVCDGWRIVFLYLILNIKLLHKTKADAWLGSHWLEFQSVWVLHVVIMQMANNSILTDTVCVHEGVHKHIHTHINLTTAQLELSSFKVFPSFILTCCWCISPRVGFFFPV